MGNQGAVVKIAITPLNYKSSHKLCIALRIQAYRFMGAATQAIFTGT